MFFSNFTRVCQVVIAVGEEQLWMPLPELKSPKKWPFEEYLMQLLWVVSNPTRTSSKLWHNWSFDDWTYQGPCLTLVPSGSRLGNLTYLQSVFSKSLTHIHSVWLGMTKTLWNPKLKMKIWKLNKNLHRLKLELIHLGFNLRIRIAGNSD